MSGGSVKKTNTVEGAAKMKIWEVVIEVLHSAFLEWNSPDVRFTASLVLSVMSWVIVRGTLQLVCTFQR